MTRLIGMPGFLAIALAIVGALPAHADIQRFMQVAPGILRGDQPDTLEDYRRLKGIGVRTLLNLRDDDTVDRESAIAAQMGFGFESVPMSGFFSPSEATVTRALDILTDPVRQPVFVHCKLGKDRTGLIVGLYRVHFEEWPREIAYREMRQIGFNPALLGLTSYFFSHTPDLD